MVKMYKSSNIFGIVGSSLNPNLKRNEIIIWDDQIKKVIYKYKFKKEVINLELTEDSIIIVCYSVIYVFDFKNFQLIDIINTGPNPKGLMAISHDERTIIVYPSTEDKNGKLTIKNYKLKSFLYLNPDQNDIDCFALSNDGLFLATLGKASEFIRIYETRTGEKLNDLYKGKEGKGKKESNKYISISNNNHFLSFAYKEGMIDIWTLKSAKKGNKDDEKYNQKIDINASNIHAGFLTKREESFIYGNLSDSNSEYKFIKFGNEKNSLVDLFVVTSNGKFHHAQFKEEKIKKKKELFIKNTRNLFETNS